MLACLMFADDFTGACDTGVQFFRAGLRTQVLVQPQGAMPEDVDVLVTTTESRNCTRAEAERRVQSACDALRGVSSRLVYKKIDSALRGHLATEIRVVMDTMDCDLCLVAPAFPAMGRITVGGYHLVHGVPVDRTEVGNDPGAPVGGSHLEHLLAIEDQFVMHAIGLEDIGEGVSHVQALIEGLRGTGPTAIVLDAASTDDLACIASVAARLSPAPLLCGSAGLAAHVPDAFGLSGGDAGNPSAFEDGPILTVVGSAESTTRRQVAELKDARRVREWELHVDATAHAWERPHLPGVIDGIVTHMSNGGDAVLSLVGLREGHTHAEVADAMAVLGQAVRRLVDGVRPGGLMATGGWTAVEAVRALGGAGARIVDAAATGVPVSQLFGGPYDGMKLVTKGGALGDRNALVMAMDRLRAGTRHLEADRPILGVTMGDPCGVGPEVILKALAQDEVYAFCRPVVIGHPDVLRRDVCMAGVRLNIREVDAPEDGQFRCGTVDVWNPVRDLDLSEVAIGTVCRESGQAAAECVIAAVDLAMARRIDGIVTAPLNKEAMNLAGYRYAGHTELLAARSGAERAHLMLASERLTVSHVTGHIAVHDVPTRLSTDLVYETIALSRDALVSMGRPDPRLAICGLNPHAGENGLFGHEDAEIIRPAVERALANGWRVDGPLPADTTFLKVYDGLYDGVVAMYHDQGHVPAKLVAFDEAVNVTLGLPIVRTSVDHGTAFDIAGTGRAKAVNMVQALRVGAQLARGRRKAVGSGK